MSFSPSLRSHHWVMKFSMLDLMPSLLSVALIRIWSLSSGRRTTILNDLIISLRIALSSNVVPFLCGISDNTHFIPWNQSSLTFTSWPWINAIVHHTELSRRSQWNVLILRYVKWLFKHMWINAIVHHRKLSRRSPWRERLSIREQSYSFIKNVLVGFSQKRGKKWRKELKKTNVIAFFQYGLWCLSCHWKLNLGIS